jgi:uncharacterized protein (TIGR00725 family)
MVAVVGGADASSEDYRKAMELGRLLATGGFTVVCGGGTGVMEAVCRGAAEAGGKTVGILPGNHRSDANSWVGTVIVTGMGTARNRIIALTGQVMVAVGGRYGTLSEIAYGLQAGLRVLAMGDWSDIPGVTPVNTPQEAMKHIIDELGDDHAQH